MLAWSRARYCWVPQSNQGTLRGAPLTTRMVVVYLAKLADDDGAVLLGSTDVFRALVRIIGVHADERRAFLPIVEAVVRSPCVRVEGERLVVVDYRTWQTTRDTRRRLYEREAGGFALLKAFPRMLAAELIRMADDEGLIAAGETAEALAHALVRVPGETNRSELRKALEARVRSAAADLIREGFLQPAEAHGLAIRNFVDAQSRTEKRPPRSAEADSPQLDTPPTKRPQLDTPPTKRPQLDAPPTKRPQLDAPPPRLSLQQDHPTTPTGRVQDPHRTGTGRPQDHPTTPTGRVQDPHRTGTGQGDVSARKDSTQDAPSVPFRDVPFHDVPDVITVPDMAPPTLRSVLSTPAEVEGVAHVAPAPFKLTSEDEGPKKKTRSTKVRADTIPADGTAAKSLYDAIVSDEVIRAIVPNPGEFALHCTNTNYRDVPIDRLIWQVRDAGLYLRSPACRRLPTVRGGWQFMRNQFDRAANDFANDPRPAHAPVMQPVKMDGRHTSHVVTDDARPRSTVTPYGVLRTADPLMELARDH